MMTVHQVNGDGAGPYKCMIDATGTGTGTNWQPITVTQNLEGNDRGRNRDTQMQDLPLTASIPAGQTCTGTVAGQSNICMVRCENPARAGPFGGCVPVQMAGAAAGNATAAAPAAAAAAPAAVAPVAAAPAAAAPAAAAPVAAAPVAAAPVAAAPVAHLPLRSLLKPLDPWLKPLPPQSSPVSLRLLLLSPPSPVAQQPVPRLVRTPPFDPMNTLLICTQVPSPVPPPASARLPATSPSSPTTTRRRSSTSSRATSRS
jgi:hypothetical protein